VADQLEASRHVIQHFGDVFTKLGHALAAIATAAGPVVGRLMHDLLTRQMLRQRLALGLVGLADRRQRFGGLGVSFVFDGIFGFGCLFGRAGFQFLEPQLELLDLAADPLR